MTLTIGNSYQVSISFDTHLQIFAPHAETVGTIRTSCPLAARRTARREMIGVVKRQKDVATFVIR